LYNGELHLLGGSKDYYSSGYTYHYKYDGDTWIRLGDLPYDFRFGSAVVYDGAIHILGGGYIYPNSSTMVGYSYHYKWENDVSGWSYVSEIPYRRFGFFKGSAVVYNNEIHIIGGESLNTNYYPYPYYHYKFDGTSWTNLGYLPIMFSSSSAITYNGYIYMFYGTSCYRYDNSSWSYYGSIPDMYPASAVFDGDGMIHLLSTSSSGTHYYGDLSTLELTKADEIPYSFSIGCAAFFNNQLHIIGGGDTKNHYIYTPSGRETRSNPVVVASSLPHAIGEASLVSFGDELHLLGGYYSDELNTHYSWNGSLWTQHGNLPFYAYGSASVVFDGEIHLIGGYGHLNDEDDHYLNIHYKLQGNSWIRLADLPVYFSGGSNAVVFNNEIHVLGGYGYIGDDSSDYLDTHYKWDSANDTWTEVSSLPMPVWSAAAVVFNEELHILGGYDYNDDYIGTHHYKWDGESWSFVGVLPNEQRVVYGHAAVLYKGSIYYAGGYDEYYDSYNKSMYKFDGLKWSFVTDLMHDFPYYISSAVYNDDIHIIGAYDDYHIKYGIKDAYVEE